MRKRMPLIVATLLIPLGFAGGYVMATANARTSCVLQVEREPMGIPAVCADISSTGITTGLLFGIAGVIVWAVAWFVIIRRTSR